MNGTEAKEAMTSGLPVVYCSGLVGAIEYDRINAIIYRPKNGRISVSLELLDKNLHSVTIAPMEEVELLVLQEQTQPCMRYTAQSKG